MEWTQTGFDGGGYDSQQNQQQSQPQQYQANNQQGQQQSGGYNNGGNQGGFQKPWQKNGGGGWKGNNGGGGGWKGGGQKPWQKNGGGQGGERRHEPPVENPDPYLPYAINGNKDMDAGATEVATRVIRKLHEAGFTVRTGGMEGIEELAERIAFDKHELYLPWRGFANKESKLTFNNPLVQGMAKKFHPTWDSLKPAIQAFLSKNVRQICGQNATSLSMFLVCWSKDGVDNIRDKTFETGNVGHAIAVASAHRIPIFNLGKPGTEERLYQFLGLS